jgi:hypothetical protein
MLGHVCHVRSVTVWVIWRSIAILGKLVAMSAGHSIISEMHPIADRVPAANQGRGRAFVLNVNGARQNTNVVTGTFPLNNHYVFVLFDSGADKSFVSIEFPEFIGLDLA